MQPKYGRKVKLCYMDSFVYEMETKDFYKGIAKDVKTKFGASRDPKNDYKPLPIGKSKDAVDIIKNELDGKIISEFVALRVKMYAYRKIGKKVKDKRDKGTKKCGVVKNLTFDDYNTYLFVGKKIIESKCCLRIRNMRCTR